MQAKLKNITMLHYLVVWAMVVQLIAYDAGRLMPPPAIMRRWLVIGLYAAVTSVIWYAARNKKNQVSTVQKLTSILVLSDIGLASFMVYGSRGMASKAVLVYILAILTSAVLNRKSAIMLGASLSVIAYVLTNIAYFVFNFNEGYKLELYGETGFYSAILLISGLIIWSLVKPYKK